MHIIFGMYVEHVHLYIHLSHIRCSSNDMLYYIIVNTRCNYQLYICDLTSQILGRGLGCCCNDMKNLVCFM